GKNKNVDCVEICTPYERLDEEYCSHFALRVNNTKPMKYIDISGIQKEAEIKSKMVKRWVAILEKEKGTYGDLPKTYEGLFAKTGVEVRNNYGCGRSSLLSYIRDNIQVVPKKKLSNPNAGNPAL
ncbi:MAG: hypothetical protein FWE79_02655, partial [Firmicutes bacterium]|nr:hypothetical protein [Bacillota bacterium]